MATFLSNLQNKNIVDPYYRTRGGPPKPAKKCYHCGTLSSADTARCPSCGADLNGPSQRQYDEKEKKGNIALIMGICAVLVIACAVAVYFLLTNQNAVMQF